MNTTITIKGTHCEACQKLLESVCRDIAGVTACSVDYHTGQTKIEHDSSFDLNLFKVEVDKLGLYSVQV